VVLNPIYLNIEVNSGYDFVIDQSQIQGRQPDAVELGLIRAPLEHHEDAFPKAIRSDRRVS
jgi:hypothetical protein